MIQFIGVLTNDYEYMHRTNILGEELQDIWTVEGVTRKAIKKALTPKLYGSSQSVKQLWDKNKIEYTQKQLNYVNSLIEKGLFANANKFKEFIINNVKPETSMFIKIWNDEFYIECNRFKWEETTRKTYPVYTSSQGQVKSLVREVQLTPDVNQFKRYFVTLLI